MADAATAASAVLDHDGTTVEAARAPLDDWAAMYAQDVMAPPLAYLDDDIDPLARAFDGELENHGLALNNAALKQVVNVTDPNAWAPVFYAAGVNDAA